MSDRYDEAGKALAAILRISAQANASAEMKQSQVCAGSGHVISAASYTQSGTAICPVCIVVAGIDNARVARHFGIKAPSATTYTAPTCNSGCGFGSVGIINPECPVHGKGAEAAEPEKLPPFRPHRRLKNGERCLDCGDKDGKGGECSGSKPDAAEERAAVDEAIRWHELDARRECERLRKLYDNEVAATRGALQRLEQERDRCRTELVAERKAHDEDRRDADRKQGALLDDLAAATEARDKVIRRAAEECDKAHADGWREAIEVAIIAAQQNTTETALVRELRALTDKGPGK